MARTARLRVEALEDRLAPAAGQLDPAFGTAGIVRFTSSPLNELAVTPDGRVLALYGPLNTGSHSLRRFGPDGTPDTAFGTGGVVPIPGITPYTTSVLAPTPDGGAYVAWLGGPGYTVVRITAAGVVDPNFGTGGQALVTIPGNNQAIRLGGIAVEPDGQVVIVGDRTLDRLILGQPPRYYELALARLTTTGQLDPSFGAGGTAIVSDPSGTVNSLLGGDVVVQPDGRIVVAGAGSTTPRGVRGQVYGPAAVRLTEAGQLDPSFGAGGWSLVGFPTQVSGTFETASILSDGRVMLAGSVKLSSGATVGGAARLTEAGQLDASYGTGGTAVAAAVPSRFGPSGVLQIGAEIDLFGRAVFGVASYDFNLGGSLDTTVLRLTPGGATDTGFGTNGQVATTALPGLSGFGPDGSHLQPYPTIQPDGNVLLGGSAAAGEGLLVRLLGSSPPDGFVQTPSGAITAGGAADGTFQVLAPAGGAYANAATVTAGPGSTATLRTTTADVNGDGVLDYITGAGPGAPPRVAVFDGKTGALLSTFLAFEAGFTGGVFVAAANLDLIPDGHAEIVVTPDQGGGPRVVVFQVFPGGAAILRASFFGIDDANFRGGARAALGDMDGDLHPELVVAAGFLGGPRVAVFNGQTLLTGNPTRLVNDFFAFPGTDAQTLRNGAYVALGNVNGDSAADLIFGGGPGGAPRVFILDGGMVAAGQVAQAQANPIANFFVDGNSTDRGGVTVAATDDARATVAVGSGTGSAARVRVYPVNAFTSAGEPTTFQDVSVFGGAALPGGVFVG